MPAHERTPAGVQWARPAVATLVPAIVILVGYLVNVKGAYDFSLDELTYASVTQQVIGHNAIASATNPFLVHPPVYFLVAGGWNLVTGNRHAAPLDAIYALRPLQALLVALTAWVVGLVTTSAVRAAGVRVRLWQPTLAMAVFALSSFVLSFGRAVILETAALLLGCLVLLAALRLRASPGVYQICGLGALIGVGCLVKQTVIFAALAPMLAYLLRRDWRQVRIQIGALVVGALVWSSFPLWAVTQGHGSAFVDQESVSLRRLVGLLQTSGVNHAGPGVATATGDIKATFLQYLAGYIIFFGGALAMLVLVARRRLLSRADPLPVPHHLVLAFGFLQYGFVSFSFAFGQGNEQLVTYSAPAAAIAIVYTVVVFGPRPRRRGVARVLAPVIAIFAAAGVIGGAASFLYYYALHDDDGTTRMASYVSRHYPGCVPINASGNTGRWSAVMPGKDVTGFRDGPGALQNGTRLFLVSSKDASHAYGDMTPQFARYLAGHGTLVHRVDSRSYGTIGLYRIGVNSAVQPHPQACARSAAIRRHLPPVRSSALIFSLLLGAALVVVAAAAVLGHRARIRRQPTDDEVHLPEHAAG